MGYTRFSSGLTRSAAHSPARYGVPFQLRQGCAAAVRCPRPAWSAPRAWSGLPLRVGRRRKRRAVWRAPEYPPGDLESAVAKPANAAWRIWRAFSERRTLLHRGRLCLSPCLPGGSARAKSRLGRLFYVSFARSCRFYGRGLTRVSARLADSGGGNARPSRRPLSRRSERRPAR